MNLKRRILLFLSALTHAWCALGEHPMAVPPDGGGSPSTTTVLETPRRPSSSQGPPRDPAGAGGAAGPPSRPGPAGEVIEVTSQSPEARGVEPFDRPIYGALGSAFSNGSSSRSRESRSSFLTNITMTTGD